MAPNKAHLPAHENAAIPKTLDDDFDMGLGDDEGI